MMLLHDRLSRRFLEMASRIRRGTLIVTTPEGVVHGFGGHAPGPDARLVVRDWCMVPALALRGDIGLRDACRTGWCDTPDRKALSALAVLNADLLSRDISGHGLQMLALRVLDVLNRRIGATTAPRRTAPRRLPALLGRPHGL
ncbi:hypothetical protein [Paracoccus sp. T5]|uniref:hypothetical protein n=1 Tax=Paracoccus sp. T5 TaxID=3402161 RepID=UPI003AE4BEC3